MLAASPVPHDLMSKQLQMDARSHLEKARFYKTAQQFKMALISYDQAKVIFKHAEDERLLSLSELTSAFSQAQTPQTPQDESLRQRIAEIYVERAGVLRSLERWEKAKTSDKKARKWGHEGTPAAPTTALTSSSDSATGLSQSTEFFPARASLTLSPKTVEVCPQEKHQWVAQVFETILKQFQDLDLCQSSPSLFLVYAHNNQLGQADAEASQQVIEWLSSLRFNLYSDRTANGYQALPRPATLEEKARANIILSSQLCLLPNHSGTVDHVVLCGSALLGHYMASLYYQSFYKAIESAYQQANDLTQIETAIRDIVHDNLNNEEFHHVLTELAFLQIRYQHYQDNHGIIPLLLNSSAEQCLPKFILNSTTIRIEETRWRKPSLWKGKQTYQDEGLHVGFFKLIKQLLTKKKDRCISLMEKEIYQACLKKLREDQTHTLKADEFSVFLNQACVTALEALKKDGASNLRELNVQKAYENILAEIKQINSESRIDPEQLRQALAASYDAKGLDIQRLSGPALSMDHCYINLAIVEYEKVRKEKENPEEAKEKEAKEEKVVLDPFHRLPSVEAIESIVQNLVPLDKLFDPRELSKGKTVTPKRILVYGRAGVGKTTLCKKIVYESMQKGQWRDRFEYVLWIPLRVLKGKQSCDLVSLLHEIYFPTHHNGLALAKALVAQINGAAKDKTLFVLDGLDEAPQEWSDEFLKQLLNQPAVLITSRPHVDLNQAQPMDLELETIGFSPENVTDYLNNPAIVPVFQSQEIKHFIQTTPVIQALVNVPIQLDALCYSWDEIKRLQPEVRGSITITALYQAMINKLWRKDMLRLGKREAGEKLTANHVNALSLLRLEKLAKAEQDFLSTLAFQGLQRNQIEFSDRDLHALIEQLEAEGVNLPFTLEANLKKLSSLYTDDAEEGQRNYYFMHLTFQEFFAAKHIVQYWERGQEISLWSTNVKQWTKAHPEAFVHQHKYNPRYEIFWWFVSGLLRGQALNRFVDVLEAEPRDLFGAAHQRLMMNCLYEASRLPNVGLSPDTQDRLEQDLAQWLQFEIDQTGKITLAYQPTLPENLLLDCLKAAETFTTKRAMVQALNYRSALSDVATQASIELTKDQDNWVRCNATEALGKRSSLPESALKALIELTKDQDDGVRSSAAKALGKRSSLPESAMKALLELTKDKDDEVRRHAAEALGQQSSLPELALKALIELIKDKVDWMRLCAANALGQQSSLPESAMEVLIEMTKDQDDGVKRSAAYALGQQSSLPKSALLALIALIKNKDYGVRSNAAYALGKQSSLPESILLALIALIKSKDDEVKRSAAEALGKRSSLPESAMEALIRMTKDQNDAVRRSAADALGKRSSLPELAMEALIEMTKDQDDEVKRSAAYALGQQSSLSELAMEALIEMTKNQDDEVRRRATEALGQQSSLPELAMEALIEMTKDKDDWVRLRAAEALGKRSSLPASALKALIELIKDKGSWVGSSAAKALSEQSSLPELVMKALIELTKDKDDEVRRHAVDALGQQSSLPELILLALIELIKDKSDWMRHRAAKALSEQSSLPESALLALIELIKNQDYEVRRSAAYALGQQSSLSKPVLLALIELIKNQDYEVRRSVAKTLGKNLWTLYCLLPTLDSQQIALIYSECLLKQRFDQSVPFYIQDNNLCFYTNEGLQSFPFSHAGNKEAFKQAAQQAQQAAGIPLSSTKKVDLFPDSLAFMANKWTKQRQI